MPAIAGLLIRSKIEAYAQDPQSQANDVTVREAALRVYRDLRGLTQAALAEKAGVSRVTLAEIETGRKHGSAVTLRRLATSLAVTLDDLAQ